MDLFFYVLELYSGYTKYQHKNRVDAEKEAERLANVHPGQEFLVLAAISKCVKREVVWDRVNVSDFPF